MEKKNKSIEGRFKKLCQKAGKTIHNQRLLKNGDHILIALSGGKDSYLLLETLAERKKALPFEIRLTAVHVKMTNLLFKVDTNYMQKLCDELLVPLHIREISPDFDADEKKTPCFVCSWHRRKEIFNLSKDLNCNILAFGHHRDDALETFLMNLIYHGSISSLPYTLSMFEGRVNLIRPLLDIWEEEIREFAELRKYPESEISCPFDDQTRRRNTRKIIEQINQTYPNSKINIFHSMGNIYPDYLPKLRNSK